MRKKKFDFLLHIWEKKIHNLQHSLQKSKSKNDKLILSKISKLTYHDKKCLFQEFYNEVQAKFRLSYQKWKRCFSDKTQVAGVLKDMKRKVQAAISEDEIIDLKFSGNPTSKEKLLKQMLVKPVLNYFPSREEFIEIIMKYESENE